MSNARTLRNRLLAVILAVTLAGVAPARAHATSKDIALLQEQVNQLMDMVQRLQSTVDTKLGGLQQLVEQATDNANKMTAAVEALQQKIAAQNEALSGKMDATTGQVQSVSDSIEELKSRLDKMNQNLQSLQTQVQNLQAPPAVQPGTPGTPGTPGAQAPAMGPGAGATPAPAVSQAPPLQETYQAAVGDFNAGKYNVAEGEFQEVVQYYPQDDLAAAAQFFLGEIAYRQQNYADAISAYNVVLEKYGNSSKAPAAQLHKGLSLLSMGKRAAGIQELRSLIQKHPRAPEAEQARSKLNGMGVRISAREH